MPRQSARAPAPPADAGAFEQMLAANWSAMTGFAIRLVGAADAEDVVQEAVAAAWHLRGRYDPDLAAALHRLSRRQRVAVELFYYLGLPVAEVAHVMDCAEGTVKSTLSDARARLGALLKEGSDE